MIGFGYGGERTLPQRSWGPLPAGTIMKETIDEEHLSAAGLLPGTLQIRQGILCSVDAHGRLYLRAPRRADVALAARVVAAVRANPDAAESLAADITSVREQG